jgi:crotonobetainyl-CoA hydratase
MIVAADSAVFGLPEPKIGLIAIGGGVHRLVRQIGLKQAMGPLLTGDTISAAEGLRLGFVSEVVSAEGLTDHVAALCARIMANAPLAVELTKALAHWSLDQPSLADAMAAQDQHPAWQRWLAAEDTREGPRAFIAKRPPEWQGR